MRHLPSLRHVPLFSPQISHRGEVVDVDHGQLLLAGPLGLGRVTGTPWGQRGQVLIVRGAAGREILGGSASLKRSPFLINLSLLAGRAHLLLLPAQPAGTADHLGVVRAVNGEQLVQQVGHLSG